MKDFTDPSNVIEILEQICKLPTLGDIQPLLIKTFPTWIIGSMSGYSLDYPTLNDNWVEICQKMNIKPTEILLVEDLFLQDASLPAEHQTHKLVNTFAEILTRSGFVIRRKCDLFPCNNCGRAIPQSHIYDLMKKQGLQVPEVWSTFCSTCL